MVIVAVSLPDIDFNPEQLDAAVESAASRHQLIITTFGHLATIRNSRHLHLKRVSGTGVLELTWDPSRSELWVSYHANRVGDGWVDDAAPAFADTLSALLAPAQPPPAD